MAKQQSVIVQTERNYIYALKVLAVISIVSAHCTYVSSDTNKINILFSWILNKIGSIGVGVFFIISGYFFYKNECSFSKFFFKKIKTILLPWIMTGTCVYLYTVLRNGGLGLYSWFKFILGDGTYLYFLSLLILFYMIFFYNRKNKIFIYCSIFTSIISIWLTSLGYFSKTNPFLNPFNFIIYFSIGILIANKNILINIASICTRYKNILLVWYIILLILIKIFNISSGYWGYSTLIIQPVAILLVFGLSTKKLLYSEKILKIGQESFSIYLLHMPVAGIISNIFSRFDLWVLTLVRPFIIIGITMGFISLYKYISNRFNMSNILNPIIGIR